MDVGFILLSILFTTKLLHANFGILCVTKQSTTVPKFKTYLLQFSDNFGTLCIRNLVSNRCRMKFNQLLKGKMQLIAESLIIIVTTTFLQNVKYLKNSNIYLGEINQ